MLRNSEAFLKTVEQLPEVRLNGFQYKKCNMMLTTVFEKVRIGLCSSWKYQSQVKSDMAKTHLLTDYTLDQNSQRDSSTIVSGDLDHVENRYLLVGKSSGGLAIFDTSLMTERKTFRQVARIKGGVPGTHSQSVTCVNWYPVDAGLFTTSSYDCSLKVWDPNRMEKVEEFKFDYQIYNHHMSPVASTHSYIAVGGGKGDVILCDLRSGSSSHRLYGHTEPVYNVQWSKHNENILASGGKDKTIRLWDVRSGKSCLQILDSENTPEIIPFRHRKRIKKIPNAHHTSITCLRFTHDGLWLISFSQDGQLKVWNTSTGKNMFVRFGETYTNIKRNVHISLTQNLNPDLIFIPSKTKVFVYEVTTGALVNILSAHFSNVLGTIYNPNTGDLYSFGTDKNFLVWTPEHCYPVGKSDEVLSTVVNGDDWSSDDND